MFQFKAVVWALPQQVRSISMFGRVVIYAAVFLLAGCQPNRIPWGVRLEAPTAIGIPVEEISYPVNVTILERQPVKALVGRLVISNIANVALLDETVTMQDPAVVNNEIRHVLTIRVAPDNPKHQALWGDANVSGRFIPKRIVYADGSAKDY